MRDIPVFATELGVGSLFLKDIPYRCRAYIKLLSSEQPEAFLEECASFCRAAGAEHIYASGHSCLEQWPRHTDIYLMCRQNFDGETDSVFPLQAHCLDKWLEIYNAAMRHVPNAAYMTKQDGMELLKEKSAYFVHADGSLLGIGIAAGDNVKAIAACQKGAGERVLRAICGTLDSEFVYLEVAANNEKAIGLYERLGFVRTKLVASWYEIV